MMSVNGIMQDVADRLGGAEKEIRDYLNTAEQARAEMAAQLDDLNKRMRQAEEDLERVCMAGAMIRNENTDRPSEVADLATAGSTVNKSMPYTPSRTSHA